MTRRIDSPGSLPATGRGRVQPQPAGFVCREDEVGQATCGGCGFTVGTVNGRYGCPICGYSN